MIELVYLICWVTNPIPMDCRIVRIPKESIRECRKSAKRMNRMAPAWCNTGREEWSVDSWLKETDATMEKAMKEKGSKT